MSIDLLSRRLATLASTNAAAALDLAASASARAPQISLFANMANTTIDASVTTIITGGHTTPGVGPATYITDSLATSSLATSFPLLCAVSADGRYWRLAPQLGSISVEQAGAVAASSSADVSHAVGNVAALRAVINYLTYLYGGGTIYAGNGLIMLDAATLGTCGLNLQGNLTIRGTAGLSIWASTDPTTGFIAFTPDEVRSNLWIENLEIRGRLLLNRLTKSGIRQCTFTGTLSSQVQYSEESIDVTAAFGSTARTYHDGAGTYTTSPDFTATLTGSTMAITLSSSASLLGQTRYHRYVESDYIPLDATKRYVVRFDSGFMAGEGGNPPIIKLFDANRAPVSAGQGLIPSGGTVDNVYVPNSTSQNSSSTSFISGASFIKIAVGGYRDYSTVVGRKAIWDLSKITCYSLVNELATLSASQSPGDDGLLYLNNADDLIVENCNFNLIDRGCIKLVNSKGCTIIGNRSRFCLQGATDDGGVGNRILENDFDLRMKTTGGALIGSSAYRLRGIGGTGSDQGEYSRNLIRGASWGIEVLPQNRNYRAVLSNNIVEAEYCGLSLACGDFFCSNNRVLVSSDALFGIEVPGDNTNLSPSYGNCRAVLDSNDIRWNGFAGYPGFGVSAVECSQVTVSGGFIRAPILMQSVAANAIGELRVKELDGEFGCTAVLSRGGPVCADFGRLQPYLLCYPLGTATAASIFDIQANNAANRTAIKAAHIVMGLSCLLNCTNSRTVLVSMGEVTTLGGDYVVDYMMRLSVPSGNVAVSWELSDCNFVTVPTNLTASRWCLVLGTPYTGSRIVMRGNRWAGIPVPMPDGPNLVPSFVTGDVALRGTYAQTLGTIAAGGTVQYTGLSLRGAVVGMDGSYSVQSSLVGGLAGLSCRAWPSADNLVTVEITNISGGDVTRSTSQTLRVTGARAY